MRDRGGFYPFFKASLESSNVVFIITRVVLDPVWHQATVPVAALLREWLAVKPNGEPLWGNSRSWWYKAAEILRHDLTAAELPHHVKTREGKAVVDFHSFRAYRISAIVCSGASLAVVKNVARLSSESLVARYTKIADEEVTRTINSIPVPNVERRTHSRTHSAPHSLGKSGRLTANQASGV